MLCFGYGLIVSGLENVCGTRGNSQRTKHVCTRATEKLHVLIAYRWHRFPSDTIIVSPRGGGVVSTAVSLFIHSLLCPLAAGCSGSKFIFRTFLLIKINKPLSSSHVYRDQMTKARDTFPLLFEFLLLAQNNKAKSNENGCLIRTRGKLLLSSHPKPVARACVRPLTYDTVFPSPFRFSSRFPPRLKRSFVPLATHFLLLFGNL